MDPEITTKESVMDAEKSNREPFMDAETGVPERELKASIDQLQESALDRHTDPFAIRKGKTLVWSNVNMTLSSTGADCYGRKSDEPDRKILDDVWGEVPSKETTAIMGPSGAGKTCLLNVLSGRASSHGRIKISSDIRLNNYAVDPTNIAVRKSIAFVAQDDSLQMTATPREAIRFSAKLRLPRSMTESQLDKLTTRMISELGLKSCADTIVGGELIKGISGGERKRTSVGVELVVKPALVFLDEPTSGLDSFSAVQLCQVLKKVANAGACVLFTIHQPSSEIFNSFDQVIVMNKGRVMCQGAVSEVPAYFAERGYPNPPNYNPADWIMQVAQSVELEELDDAGFFPKDAREMGVAFEPEEGKDALGITITWRPIVGRRRESVVAQDEMRLGFLAQVRLLFVRELRNVYRDFGAVATRFGIGIFTSLLVGLIFLNVGETDPTDPVNVNSHFGALIMVLLGGMFSTAEPALAAFPQERPIFLREYSTNHYSVAAYFISHFTMEAFLTALQNLLNLLIGYYMIGFQGGFGIIFAACYMLAMASTALAVALGSAVKDVKLAQELLPILFVPQMLFAGFFVVPDLIPAWLRWAQYLCTLTYAVRISLVAEFGDCGTDACVGLLDRTWADPDNTWWYWLVLCVLFVVFRGIALILLRMNATKFY